MKPWIPLLLCAFGLFACAPAETVDDATANANASPKANTEKANAEKATDQRSVPDPFRFKIDFWGMVEDEAGKPKRTALTKRHILKSNAQLALKLDPGAGKVYVLYQDAKGELAVLYPAADQKPGVADVLEPGTTLDEQTGLERFYVIASKQPIAALDKAIAALHAETDGASASVIREVMKLRSAHEKMETAPPRPVTIGGQMRGDPTALEYEVRGVLCKTITIDHR